MIHRRGSGNQILDFEIHILNIKVCIESYRRIIFFAYKTRWENNFHETYLIKNFCWNHSCTIEMYWTCVFHKKITSLMYRFWEILININLFQSIESRLTPDITKMYTKYDVVFYLNLKFWQFFNKIDSSEYVIQWRSKKMNSILP